METLLYIVWWLIPAFFFLLALWGWLEARNRQKTTQDSYRDFFRQGIFVSVCVIVCILIDVYLLSAFADLFSDWLPRGFFQVILLPVVLLIAALVFGGSEEIRIMRAPRPTAPKKKR